MTGKPNRAVTLLLLLGLALSVPHRVEATAITDSELAFSNLQILPAAGTIQFGTWTAQAFAQANNSLGELQADFQSSVGGQVQAAALANGRGTASGITLTASADSHGNIPGTTFAAASSVGRAGLFTSVLITGGTGAVDVVFSLGMAGLLHGFADEFGSFETELVATLEVDGTPTLFDRFTLAGGPNFPDTTQLISKNLSATQSLAFDTSFFVFVEADSESKLSNVPEPATFVLVLTGLGAVAGVAWKRRVGTTAQATPNHESST
jgi:hypothetical protein